MATTALTQLTAQQQEIVDTINHNIALIKEELANAQGKWVAAGYAENTNRMFAFIGMDKGYMGAPLSPLPIKPVTYSSEQEAAQVASRLHYQTARKEQIRLVAMSAVDYHQHVLAQTEGTLESIIATIMEANEQRNSLK